MEQTELNRNTELLTLYRVIQIGIRAPIFFCFKKKV
jgi:hypothetical protein